MLPRLIALSLLTLTIACGGGGGGGGGAGGGTTPTTQPNQPGIPPTNSFEALDNTNDPNWIVSQAEADVFRTTEYNRQSWGMEAIHAAEAYAALNKNAKNIGGDGLEVVIIDSGVDQTHPDIFANINAADSFNYVNNNNDFSDNDEHGTGVASIAAGVKNDIDLHGVAFNSGIVSAKLVVEGQPISATQIDNALQNSINANTTVMNASWGYDNYTTYNGTTVGANFFDSAFITSLTNHIKNNDLVFVAAAGNDGDNFNNGQSGQNPNTTYLDNPKPTKPALFANNDDLAGHVLAVVAVDEEGRIADFSNICGVTKNFCLAAPGQDVDASFQTSQGDFIFSGLSGTSFAAPFVTGAVAVIRSAWPHLTAEETTRLLLVTATDFGDPGVDDLYGRGMLNLYAAVQDVGPDMVVSNFRVNSTGFRASNSSFTSDPIFGNSFSTNIAPKLKDAVFFDSFGRDFKASLGQKITTRSNQRLITFNLNQILLDQYQTKQNPVSFSLFQNHLKTNLNFRYRTKSNSYFENISRDFISENAQNERQQGFSLNQDVTKNTSFGFASNIDLISNSQDNIFNQFSFLSFNSLTENPFQNFINQNSNQNSNNNFSQKNFRQLFLAHKLFSNKLKLRFSNQSSYLSDINNFSSVTSENNIQNQVSDLNFEFKPLNNLKLSISVGELTEYDNNILNSKALGVFQSSNDSKTSYLKLAISKNLSQNNYLIANISEARTRINGDENGIFRDFSNVKSRSMALGFLNTNFFNSNIGLIYNEPLRVYSGRVTIDIPTARDIEGNVTRLRDQASLEPDGKERNIELFFSKNLNNSSNISLNFLTIKDSGNIKREGLDYLGLVNYGLRF